MLTLRASLYAQSERYRHLSVALAREQRQKDAEHRGILDACLARDADRADKLVAAHLMKTMHIILNSPLLANRPGDEGN